MPKINENILKSWNNYILLYQSPCNNVGLVDNVHGAFKQGSWKELLKTAICPTN